MQFNVVVDVVIGLVVLFWMVATSSSFIVEAIVSVINIRGKVLELYVREMILGGQAVQALRARLKWFAHAPLEERAVALAAAGPAQEAEALNVLDHPLIRRLGKPSAGLAGNDTAPSYIPSELFAKALIDRLRQVYGALLTMREVLAALRPQFPQLTAAGSALRDWQVDTAAGGRILLDLMGAVAKEPGALTGMDAALKTLLPGSAAARALKVLRDHIGAGPVLIADLWKELEPIFADRGALGVDDLQAIASSGRLPPSLAAAIKPLLDGANHDIETFRKQFAAWYDSVMDRASGWFRRYTQLWLFAVALVLAFTLNLDSIYIGQRLVGDRGARDAAVRLGQTVVAEGENAKSLPQKFEFVRRYKDGKWAEPLLSGNNAAEATQAAARQMQPLLLVTGSYVGPLLALQGAALSMDRRCPEGETEPACSSRYDFAKEWEEFKDQRTALAAALCRHAAQGSALAKRDKAATLGNDELLADFKHLCPALPEITGKQVKTADDARKAMHDWWTNSQISWSGSVAGASLAALFKAGKAETQANRSAQLRDAVQVAVKDFGQELQSAEDLLARMPYVGSTQAAVQRWHQPGQGLPERTWGVLLNIAGWLITALMASLGAPIWFDLLNKLVNRRIAGPKPETAAASGAD